MLHHPCILGGPQQKGQNQSGPKRGQKYYITPAFSGVPNKGDKIKAGPKEGGNATSPLHSQGSMRATETPHTSVSTGLSTAVQSDNDCTV